MKLYRVQANYKNIYIDEMLEAENDKAVLEDFVKKVDLGDVTARYIRILAKRHGLIPAGAQGAGHEAWLFVDEIIVE